MDKREYWEEERYDLEFLSKSREKSCIGEGGYGFAHLLLLPRVLLIKKMIKANFSIEKVLGKACL